METQQNMNWLAEEETLLKQNTTYSGEKKEALKIISNLDLDGIAKIAALSAGKELGKKLSDAKREATEKVGEASVKVKDAAKKVSTKARSKKAPAKKTAVKKTAAKKPVAKKPVAKKPKA
jgi:hypothetical protein